MIIKHTSGIRFLSRSLRAGVLISFLATVILMASQQMASAEDNTDGGAVSGSGGHLYTGQTCVVTGWKWRANLGPLQQRSNNTPPAGGWPAGSGWWAPKNGANADCENWGTGKTSFYNSPSAGAGSEGVNAPGCWDHKDTLVSVWYVVDGSDKWSTTNKAGDDADEQSRASVTKVINGSTWDAKINAQRPANARYPLSSSFGPSWLDYVKNQAKNSLRANLNTIVCVWYDPNDDLKCGNDKEWGAYNTAVGVDYNTLVTNATFANCYLKCPSADAQLKPGMANALIPITYDTDAKRGAYCFSDVKTSTRSWDVTDQRYLPFAFMTTVLGTAPHPGPTVWDGTSSTVVQNTAVYNLIKDCLYKSRANSTNAALCWPTDAQLNTALAQDNAAKHPTVDLNAANKQYMAEGGLATVKDYTIFNTVTLVNRTEQSCTSNAVFTFNTAGVKTVTWNPTCSTADTTNKNANGWVDTAPSFLSQTGWSFEPSTPQLNKGYQFMANHCNATDFNAVLNDGTTDTKVTGDAAGTIFTGDSSRWYAGSMVSKIYTGAEISNNKLPWGSTTTGASSKPGFFDKLCYFPGDASDSVNNRPLTTQADKSYTFYRDGENKLVGVTNAEGSDGKVTPYFTPSPKGETVYTTTPYTSGYTVMGQDLQAAATYYYTYNNERYNSAAVAGVAYQAPVTAGASGTYKVKRATVADNKAEACKNDAVYIGGSMTTFAWNTNSHGPYSFNTNGRNDWVAGGSYNDNPETGDVGSNTCFLWTIVSVTNRAARAAVPAVAAQPASYSNTNVGLATANFSSSAAAQTDINNNCKASHSQTTVGQSIRTGCSGVLTNTAQWQNYTRTYTYCPAPTSIMTVVSCAPITSYNTTSTVFNVVNYNRENPIATIVTRDAEGTPLVGKSNFKLTTGTGANSADIFNNMNGSAAAPAQTQFTAPAAYSNSVVSVVPGAFTRMATWGIWASESNKPQVLTFAWYFKPQVQNTFPVSNIGFGTNGGANMTWTSGQVATGVIGRVDAVNNSIASPSDNNVAPMQTRTYQSTGSGSVNTMDKALPFGNNKTGDRWASGSPSAFSPYYWTVRFSRTTGE